YILTRLSFFIYCSLLLQISSSAKSFRNPAPATFITKFPFTLSSRGIIIVKGLFANYPDTLNFVLDTGCGGISLDSTTAKNFNLTTVKTEETIKGISQIKAVE